MNQLGPFTRANLKSHRAIFATARRDNFVDSAIVEIYNGVIQMAIETNKQVYEYEIREKEMNHSEVSEKIAERVTELFPEFIVASTVSSGGHATIFVDWSN